MDATHTPILKEAEEGKFNIFINGLPIMRVSCSKRSARWHFKNKSWTHPHCGWLYYADRLPPSRGDTVDDSIFDDFEFAC